MTLLRTDGAQAPEIWCRLRRGPAWIPQHRRACARRCAVGGGPLRRRGRARRPGHLLLPRRAGLAFVLPLDDRAQHRRARRAEPVRRRRPLPLAAARERPGDRRHGHRRSRASGPPSTTATCRCARRPGTAARSGWTGPRAVSTSSTRSTAVATTSGWPSISAPTCRRELNGSRASCAGPPRPPRGRHGWNCRRPAAVEPAPRRDRSDPRLVLTRPGTPHSRLHAYRPRTPGP